MHNILYTASETQGKTLTWTKGLKSAVKHLSTVYVQFTHTMGNMPPGMPVSVKYM